MVWMPTRPRWRGRDARECKMLNVRSGMFNVHLQVTCIKRRDMRGVRQFSAILWWRQQRRRRVVFIIAFIANSYSIHKNYKDRRRMLGITLNSPLRPLLAPTVWVISATRAQGLRCIQLHTNSKMENSLQILQTFASILLCYICWSCRWNGGCRAYCILLCVTCILFLHHLYSCL